MYRKYVLRKSTKLKRPVFRDCGSEAHIRCESVVGLVLYVTVISAGGGRVLVFSCEVKQHVFLLRADTSGPG